MIPSTIEVEEIAPIARGKFSQSLYSENETPKKNPRSGISIATINLTSTMVNEPS